MEKRGIKYGLLITVSLIIYFMSMTALDLEHNIALRSFNAIFMFTGIFLGIRRFKRQMGDDFRFLSGFGLGLIMSLTVATSFGLFFATYLGASPAFLAELQTLELQGTYMNAVGLVALVFIEAVASGLLFTYASMQYLKTSKFAEAGGY